MNISVTSLSVNYDRKKVLSNIFLDLPAGYLYGVIGPNGAGKSTLFKAMLGLVESSSGKVSFGGKKVEEVRKQVVYLPQKSDVDWSFPATVFDVVMMGRYPHKKVFQRLSDYDFEQGIKAMKELGISDLKDRQIGELSGGQQQRVFLARALCQEAEVFFLDEPFVGVDMLTEEKIIGLLKQQAQMGKTLLVVHHDLQSVAEYFDKVILLNQRLIATGDTETTFTEEMVARTYGGQLPILQQTEGIEAYLPKRRRKNRN